VGWCDSLEMEAKCLLRRFDCSLGEGIVLLFVVIASCVSGVSVFSLLRLRMSLQSLEGLVLYVIVLRSEPYEPEGSSPDVPQCLTHNVTLFYFPFIYV